MTINTGLRYTRDVFGETIMFWSRYGHKLDLPFSNLPIFGKTKGTRREPKGKIYPTDQTFSTEKTP